MAEATGAALQSVRPLTQRLAETPPWSPARLALAVAGALFALFFALELLFDRLPMALGSGTEKWQVETRVNCRIALVMILLVAYLPAAYAYGVRGARRTIDELRPFLRPGSEASPPVASVGRFAPALLRRAGWVGIAYAFLIPFVTDHRLDVWFFWNYAIEPVFQRAMLPVIGWFGGRFVYSMWAESRRLSQIGRDHVRVDLLDLRSLAPLTRQGLRCALLVVGVLSILALYLYDFDKRGLFPVVAFASGIVLASAATALLLPLRGAHQAIVAAKRAELDWCDAELRRARADFERSAGSDKRGLADLVAWRSLVSSVQEWPIDAPTLRRFVLYLAIPLGSWLGGAFVDVLVDRVLR